MGASSWEGVVSGTSAAILSNVAVYPLDVIKTRLQVRIQPRRLESEACPDPQRGALVDTVSQVLREEGVPGLYRGLSSSVIGTASMNFTYFYWSAVARSSYRSILQFYNLADTSGITSEFALGALGGTMSQLCTNPISVIITRQQTSKAEDEKSTWETVREILRSEDGWTGLWRGFKVNVILVVNPMITYGVYQWLRESLARMHKKIGPIEAFVLGALSKVLATIVTHPLIVAKTMLQSKPPECRQGKPFRGFTEVLLYIVRHEGFPRMYKGLAPQIIKGFLTQGLMMMMKERVEILMRLLISVYMRRLPGARASKRGVS